jgi:uracil-DNA glycosylase
MKNIQKSYERCPKCGKILVAPFGNPASPYLAVGDFPGYQETIQNVPFAFRKPNGYRMESPRSGDVLKDELTRVGLSLNQFLLTNLWQHQKDEKGCDLNLHLNQLVRLFKDRTHVLLMGSEVTQALLGVKVNAVSGLQVEVPGFKKVHFWASPNPALAMSQPIGELRLAFTRFADDILGDVRSKRTLKTK